MKLKKLFNTTEEKIKSKEHNILIPICLGNKFFSHKGVLTDNVKEYLDWALKNTKNKVLFLVIDKIQDTNYFVRNKTASERASLRRVLKDGSVLIQNLKKFISTLSKDKQSKIAAINWQEYFSSDKLCGEITCMVYKEFKNNREFRDKVLKSVKESVLDRRFREEAYWKLCDYVLDEFSIAYSGVEYKGVHYDLYPYPKTDSVLYFISDIMEGKCLEKLRQKLPNRKTAWSILS